MARRNKTINGTRNRNRNRNRNKNKNKNKTRGRGPSILANLINMFKNCLKIHTNSEFDNRLHDIKKEIEELTQQKNIFISEHATLIRDLNRIIDNKENDPDSMFDIVEAETKLHDKKRELKKILKKLKKISGLQSISRTYRTSRTSRTLKTSKNNTVRAITMR